MGLIVQSPRHSLVSFDQSFHDVVLPMYNHVAVAFQFIIPPEALIPYNDVIEIKLADTSGVVINPFAWYPQDMCFWGKIENLDFDNDFPITVGPAYDIPAGIYTTPDELLAAIKTTGLNAASTTFLHCCSSVYNLSAKIYYDNGGTPDTKFIYINFYKALQQVTILDDDDALFDSGVIMPVGTCFKYKIIHTTGSRISNTFVRAADSTYLTKIRYWNNEDTYGFKYPTEDCINELWLPMFLKFPKWPENRKVYIKSDKSFKVQAATIDKEWELEVDYFPGFIHEKIVVAHAHDNVYYFNRQMTGFVNRKDDYDVDWKERQDVAMAKSKIQQTFEGRNSNCEKRKVCVPFTPAVPTTGIILRNDYGPAYSDYYISRFSIDGVNVYHGPNIHVGQHVFIPFADFGTPHTFSVRVLAVPGTVYVDSALNHFDAAPAFIETFLFTPGIPDPTSPAWTVADGHILQVIQDS